ncbi:hypothetical protein ACFV3E_36555 [Streptomyces sp. NPDC059718]
MTDTRTAAVPAGASTPAEVLLDLTQMHLDAAVTPQPRDPGAQAWRSSTANLAAYAARLLLSLQSADPAAAAALAQHFDHMYRRGDLQFETCWLEKHVPLPHNTTFEDLIQVARGSAVLAEAATPNTHQSFPDATAAQGSSPTTRDQTELDALRRHAVEVRVPVGYRSGGYGEVVIRRESLARDAWCVTDGANTNAQVWLDGCWVPMSETGLTAAHAYDIAAALDAAEQAAAFEISHANAAPAGTQER